MPGTGNDVLRLVDCPRCGYDIALLPSPHYCPECGFAYDRETVCLEIARGPIMRRSLLALLFVLLVFVILSIMSVRLMGLPGLIQWPLNVALVAWPLYIGVQRYRFARLNLPYMRLVITPRGYRVVRGRRWGPEKSWPPNHDLQFADNGRSYSVALVSRNPTKLGLPILAVPLLVDARQASALRTRIRAYINAAELPEEGDDGA